MSWRDRRDAPVTALQCAMSNWHGNDAAVAPLKRRRAWRERDDTPITALHCKMTWGNGHDAAVTSANGVVSGGDRDRNAVGTCTMRLCQLRISARNWRRKS